VRIEYDGSNGAAIADALTEVRRRNDVLNNTNYTDRIEVNQNYKGDALSLDQITPDDQRLADRWRVPRGYTLDTETGAVFDADGVPQDYARLVEIS